jgi:quinol monooxygenase YgiN
MIVVAGTVAINPASREEAARVALKMVAATQQESGCLAYDFWCDLADPNRFHVFEEWETQEALEAHFQTSHMAEFMQALPTLVASAPNIMRYEVDSVSQLI